MTVLFRRWYIKRVCCMLYDYRMLAVLTKFFLQMASLAFVDGI